MKGKNVKKEKKRYSIWDNCRYTFCYLRQKEGKKVLAVCGGDVVMSILLPFLEAALAGAVSACLISGKRPEKILLLVAGYVLLLQAARFAQGHLRLLRKETLFMFRGHMMDEYYDKILRIDGQSLESAQGQKKAEAASRNLFSGDEQGIEAYAGSYLELLFNLGGLVLYSVIVGRSSLILLALLAVQTIISSCFQFLAGKRAYYTSEEANRHWRAFQYLRRESILPENGKDIRLYRMDQWFLRRFYEWIDRIEAICHRERTGFMAADILEKVLSFGRNVLVYGYLIREMLQGGLTLPAFLLYVGIVAGFGAWMNGLFEALRLILENERPMDDYRDFMDFGVMEPEGKPGPRAAGAVHEIRLENVCFCYEGSESDTLHDISLTIRPGEKLALVGLNGAGKTTLIKLLCGFLRPTAGHIYLDGQELQSLSQREVFREFSVVFQEVFAFSFSLEDNVCCGRKDEERLKESLEKAGIWEKVQTLPKGVRTAMNKDLDEEGAMLSGGELQKLMLARALYKDAPVVILDEPTAALDPIAESEMYEKYDGMIRGRTGIFISHRLSSTRFCDRILFMEKGRIVEEGDHESLMEKKGAYAELFGLQARYYQQKRQQEESYA